MVAKRVSIDWNFQPKKCSKRYKGDDDRISQLPDDILVAILCLLSLKEAARTSVLSTRWINLWKHTSSLDFDADSALDKIARRKELWRNESDKYVKWVNSVLQSHKSPTLKEFRICFDLSRPATNTITEWLEYAFARQVQRLEFDLSPASVSRHGRPDLNYVFPEELLIESSGGGSPLHACLNHHLRKHFDFKHLKALSLKFVTVTREAIEFFLNNCPVLETLIVETTENMSNLQVCGSSLALKHLELSYCYQLDFVKVSAPNLTSLTVLSSKDLILENVPMLHELTVTCGYLKFSVKKLLPAISCCISQLESLTLLLEDLKGSMELNMFPKMPTLKKLVIDYCTKGDESLIVLTPLIRASPNLQEFVLKLTWYELSRSDREVDGIVRFRHEHLKVVKFYGYYGRSSDVEFVGCFLKSCVVLEKVIIDPHCIPSFPRVPINPAKLAEEITARHYAKQQLEAQVPEHIELVIL